MQIAEMEQMQLAEQMSLQFQEEQLKWLKKEEEELQLAL